jgi:hypothetical protein
MKFVGVKSERPEEKRNLVIHADLNDEIKSK